MNTNEELVNRAKSNARWLREGEERLLDYATDSTKPYEQISEENNVATPENLRRIRREAENTENAIEAARNATQAVGSYPHLRIYYLVAVVDNRHLGQCVYLNL